jgi:hypothetical protein
LAVASLISILTLEYLFLNILIICGTSRLRPRMRYVFDISDTGGKKQNLTWSLEGENLAK